MTAKNKEDTVQQLSVRITVKGETLQVESGLKITNLPSACLFWQKLIVRLIVFLFRALMILTLLPLFFYWPVSAS